MPKSHTISIRIDSSDYLEAQQIAEANSTSVHQVIRACAIHSLREIVNQSEPNSNEPTEG